MVVVGGAVWLIRLIAVGVGGKTSDIEEMTLREWLKYLCFFLSICVRIQINIHMFQCVRNHSAFVTTCIPTVFSGNDSDKMISVCVSVIFVGA